MRTTRSVDAPCGFRVAGRLSEQLSELESCSCETLIVTNGTYLCWECGTIYGLVYGWSRMPRRTSLRRHRNVGGILAER